jgi:hypothetical protein
MQRPRKPRLRKAAIQFDGILLGVRVNEHDRINGGAVLVISLNAPEILIHQSSAGEQARFHCLMDLRNGDLFDIKRRGSLCRQQWRCEERENQQAMSENHLSMIM